MASRGGFGGCRRSFSARIGTETRGNLRATWRYAGSQVHDSIASGAHDGRIPRGERRCLGLQPFVAGGKRRTDSIRAGAIQRDSVSLRYQSAGCEEVGSRGKLKAALPSDRAALIGARCYVGFHTGAVRLALLHDVTAVRRHGAGPSAAAIFPRVSLAWQAGRRENFAMCFSRVVPVMMPAFAIIAVVTASATGVAVAGSPAKTPAGQSEIRR